MQTFDQSIYNLYMEKLINYDEGLKQASNPDEFKLRIEGIRSTSDAAKEEMEKSINQFERLHK